MFILAESNELRNSTKDMILILCYTVPINLKTSVGGADVSDLANCRTQNKSAERRNV